MDPVSWDELRAGCPMVSCDGDQDAWPEPGGPRCYCDYQARRAAWSGQAADPDRSSASDRNLLAWHTTSEVTWSVIATEEPGRTMLAPWQRDWAKLRADGVDELEERRARRRAADVQKHVTDPLRHLIAEQAKIDAYFRGDPPIPTLAQARMEWLCGVLDLGGFLAAVERADLPELERLRGAPWRRPWWKKLWMRVLRAAARRTRVM